MAVLKHIAIKNADYSAAVCYLKYQHDERHLKPLLDENGNMMLRSEFHMNGVNCNPDTFDLECEMLNDQYRKNYRYDEVKSHHYIISFDPRDKDEHNLTGEKAQTLGLEFVKEHLPGHQALVCTHMDGHNGSGNIHVHIIINSLRKLDIEPPPHTTRTICRRNVAALAAQSVCCRASDIPAIAAVIDDPADKARAIKTGAGRTSAPHIRHRGLSHRAGSAFPSPACAAQ